MQPIYLLDCYISKVTLRLSKISFVNDKIFNGWFNADISIVRLLELDLNLENIIAIEDNSFSTKHFQYLEHLYLRNMKLHTLTTNLFNGLFIMTSLIIETIPIAETIEENILWPMNKTLTLLQINAIPTINLNNLTEKIKMHSLNVITISYSEIKTINDNSLSGLNAVTTLKLNYCKIKTISSKAFESIIDTIVLIDLQYNQIKSIAAEVFNEFVIQNRPIKVLINENPWDCYNLSDEFINLINTNVDIFGETICASMDTTIVTSESNEETPTKETTFLETSPFYSTTPSSSIKIYDEFSFISLKLFVVFLYKYLCI